jgi:hypothetical protein
LIYKILWAASRDCPTVQKYARRNVSKVLEMRNFLNLTTKNNGLYDKSVGISVKILLENKIINEKL